MPARPQRRASVRSYERGTGNRPVRLPAHETGMARCANCLTFGPAAGPSSGTAAALRRFWYSGRNTCRSRFGWGRRIQNSRRILSPRTLIIARLKPQDFCFGHCVGQQALRHACRGSSNSERSSSQPLAFDPYEEPSAGPRSPHAASCHGSAQNSSEGESEIRPEQADGQHEGAVDPHGKRQAPRPRCPAPRGRGRQSWRARARRIACGQFRRAGKEGPARGAGGSTLVGEFQWRRNPRLGHTQLG